jgi:hypothetical protein
LNIGGITRIAVDVLDRARKVRLVRAGMVDGDSIAISQEIVDDRRAAGAGPTDDKDPPAAH